MDWLLLLMLSTASVALALGIAGRRRVGWVPLAGEGLMLVAMLDGHVGALGVVPAPFWALLLGGCAMTTALVDRLRQARGRHEGDRLHALGMVLGAVFVLLGDASHHGGGGGAHAHAAALLGPVVVAVVVHAAAVVWTVTGDRATPRESARRLAALVSVLAMGAMAAVH